MEYKMTEEMRQSLLGLLPFSTEATLEYVPAPYLRKNADGVHLIPEELRPIFTLRPMTRSELDTLKSKFKTQKITDDDAIRSLIAPVIMGWRNMIDIGSEQELLYKASPTGGVDPDLFRSIPTSVISDLGICVLRMNGLVAAESLGL